MRLTCKYILFMSFPVLYSASVLMLVIPQMVAADGHLLRGEPLAALTLVCRELHRPEWDARLLGLYSSSAGDNISRPYRAHQPPTGEKGWVELHVPVALLQALQTTERGGAVVELQVPAALLTLLQTVGLEELP
jgi:hypothetical protein